MYGKLRRTLADEWEARFTRAYFCAGPFEGAQGVVWRQACNAEANTAQGMECATLLTDLYKYYGTLDLQVLALRAHQVDFPVGISYLCIAMYSQA
eukprot:1250055-Pyramimonas_sp.AAC.1